MRQKLNCAWALAKKSLVCSFIILNAFMIIADSLPDKSVVAEKFLYSIRYYQMFFALEQAWSMFAPVPGGINSYLDADLTFTDGSKEKWTFPRPSQIDGVDKFLAGERYRKYSQENLIPMERSEVWFDLSHYVAREVDRIEKKGRHRVLEDLTIYRHTSLVQAPDKEFIPHGQKSTKFASEAVFNYRPDLKVRHEASFNN